MFTIANDHLSCRSGVPHIFGWAFTSILTRTHTHIMQLSSSLWLVGWSWRVELSWSVGWDWITHKHSQMHLTGCSIRAYQSLRRTNTIHFFYSVVKLNLHNHTHAHSHHGYHFLHQWAGTCETETALFLATIQCGKTNFNWNDQWQLRTYTKL